MIRPVTWLLMVLLSIPMMVNSAENTTFVYPPWKHTWGIVRATPFKLRMFVGNETRFNNPQGIAVTRMESWEDPEREGDDDEITAYGVNSGDNCIIYNRSMYSLGIYGLERKHKKLKHPWGIAADSKGNVYVADRGNARVVRLFNPKDDLQYRGVIGGPGSDAGQFVDPRGVALDSEGNLYVTDAGLGRISVFDDAGQLKAIWEGFDAPDGIAVVGRNEKWNFQRWTKEGVTLIDSSQLELPFVVVIDSLNQRIRKLSHQGDLLAETRTSEWGVGNASLAYVTLDYHNQPLITDRNNGSIHKLDRNLNYLTGFGESGKKGDYKFDQPRGIAVYRRFGQLLVAERNGAQYLWVAVDIPKFETNVIIDTTTIIDSVLYHLEVNFFLTEPAYCSFDIVDGAGRFITRLTRSKRRYHAGEQKYTWWGVRLPKSLPDGSPQPPSGFEPDSPLPFGEYKIQAQFRATYSSRDFFSTEREATFKIE